MLIHGTVPTDRAMVFIDGTNLFERLRAAQLSLTKAAIWSICHRLLANRAQILRVYLYTSKPHWEKALETHEHGFNDNVRHVFGDAIAKADGNFKEKGVDAMLVADLIYHAAARNISVAALVSVDTDFAHAIRRVEDFGCRTAVLGICAAISERLREAADHAEEYDEQLLMKTQWGRPLRK
jgi:uncharacterized LabA/DUF88 family protein